MVETVSTVLLLLVILVGGGVGGTAVVRLYRDQD